MLFLFEAFLSYYGSTTFKDIKVYKNKNGKNYDLRDKEKFYHDLTKKDDQIVVTVYPSTIIEIEKNILPFIRVFLIQKQFTVMKMVIILFI